MADGMFTPVPLQSLVVAPAENNSNSAGKKSRKDDRIPQWGYSETKELISIRAELEKDFTQTKRNKTLWELIAGKMKEKGFRRSADQCKCKWKNLVNRYKGKELSDPENGRQCPFFDELDAIFKARLKNVGPKLLLESDGLRPKKKLRQLKRGMIGAAEMSEEESEEEDEDEEEIVLSEDDRTVQKKKRKADKERQRATAEKYRANNMQEVLEEFFQQQQRMEEAWRDALEKREHERRIREQEWRERMEKLEQDRMMREQAWWEQEEARRAQDELRSQKRDELLSALIMKMAQDKS